MTRHDASTTQTRRSRAGGRLAILVVAAAAALAACGGEPAIPELADPTEILTAAAATTADATAVHIDLTAEGDLRLDMTGTGSAAPLDLADTTASADVDIEGGDARATFAIPGLLGLRGELIVVDGTAYAKTTLTGPLYQTFDLGEDASADPGASPDTESMVAALADFLAQPGLDPVKGDDVDCGGTTCYTVRVELTSAELAALGDGGDGADLPIPSGLPLPIPDIGDVALDLTVRVEKDTTRLAGLTAIVGTGAAGELTAEVRFSKWNEDVSVAAPPADQVQGGG
jgi:hypothetical protein